MKGAVRGVQGRGEGRGFRVEEGREVWDEKRGREEGRNEGGFQGRGEGGKMV